MNITYFRQFVSVIVEVYFEWCFDYVSPSIQFCRNLVLTNSDNVDWKLMYFILQKHYPMKEQYGDTLHFCKHCRILFWKVNRHASHNHKCVIQENST